MTYESSDEAMDAAEALSFERAGAELARHDIRWARPIDLPEVAKPALNATHIMVWSVSFSEAERRSEGWEIIPRNTRAILEWLGY